MFITTYVPYGTEGILVRVETDLRRGIPGIDITGLAEGAVREARERVRAAFRNSGLEFPLDRILINLAPAGIRKEGSSLDLPIAISLMAAAGLVPGLAELPEQLMVLGELELSGRVRPVRGVLAAAAAGLKEGLRFLIIPKENEEEAAMLLRPAAASGKSENSGKGENPAVQCAAVTSLEEAAHALILLTVTGNFPPCFNLRVNDEAAKERTAAGSIGASAGDFSEVRGRTRYKRALEIAAAGGHNLLVFGAPGSGKTMLARRLPSIMADLTTEEAVEVKRIHSLAGHFDNGGTLTGGPPFRSPHHSASAEGILGGGRTVRPGEISLAHLGILFLDEAPEFKTNVLQALREPLEDRVVTIVRAEGPVSLPADFQLILAANACPCGKLGSRSDCFCAPDELNRYWKKFGGALLDRIELRVPVGHENRGFHEPAAAESSAVIRRRVLGAVEVQRRRFRFAAGCRRNARMGPAQLETFCPLNEGTKKAYRNAAEKLGLSGRACHGALRVARTIADLAEKDLIGEEHLLEAISYRRLGDDPYDVLRD